MTVARGGIVVALIAVGVTAGCGSEGIGRPLPQTVIGPLPKLTAPIPAKGNTAAGKAVFIANGCGSCHTFKPAESHGTIGPDLDKLADYARKAGRSLIEFTRGAIVSPPPASVPSGYPTNVMPTTFGQTIKPEQLADLIAFLTQR